MYRIKNQFKDNGAPLLNNGAAQLDYGVPLLENGAPILDNWPHNLLTGPHYLIEKVILYFKSKIIKSNFVFKI